MLRRAGQRVWGRLEFAPLLAVVILFCVFEYHPSNEVGFFTSPDLMSSVAALTSSVGMVSLGVTALMIAGEPAVGDPPVGEHWSR